MNTEQAWLAIVPPRGSTPRELGPDSGPGDPIRVTPDELGQLRRFIAMVPNFPEQGDDYRQYICRILGGERVAVILQNHERGLGTPVVVEQGAS